MMLQVIEAERPGLSENGRSLAAEKMLAVLQKNNSVDFRKRAEPADPG